MHKYYLRVVFGSSYTETTIEADDVDYEENYIFFYIDGDLIASYPPSRTMIYKIEEIEDDE